jgi:hypothetical protein
VEHRIPADKDFHGIVVNVLVIYRILDVQLISIGMVLTVDAIKDLI